MNPFPGPKSVLIADNCAIHKNQYIQHICSDNGIRLEYLSPYSPDFNPVIFYLFVAALLRLLIIIMEQLSLQIEQCFYYIKAYLRRHKDWVNGLADPIDGIEAACMSIGSKLARAAFRRCGYISKI